MSLIAVWSVKVATANMLMLLLFVSGVLTDCPYRHAHLFINSPQRMEGLVGSCLQIPCDFTTSGTAKFDNRKEVFGLWFKEERETAKARNVVFSSKNKVQKYPISIIGDLSEKNCTTLFSRLTNSTNLKALFPGVYYLRIENLPYRATAFCDPLHITVTDSPQSPTINIPGNLTEAESVTVTCSALTPCPQLPPKLTWNLLKDSHNSMVKNADGTFTTHIQENITLTDKHDGFNITCSATYPVNGGTDFKTAEETRTLSVSYSPRNTSVIVSPSDPVSDGSTVNLTCSCRTNPPVVHFLWFMISNGRLELLQVDAQVYVLKVTDRDRGRLFCCGCRNDLGIQMSTGVQLTFEDDQLSEPVSAAAVLKIVGIVLLVSALIIFECWFRSRGSIKPRGEIKNSVEAVYVNTVAERALSRAQAASAKPV